MSGETGGSRIAAIVARPIPRWLVWATVILVSASWETTNGQVREALVVTALVFAAILAVDVIASWLFLGARKVRSLTVRTHRQGAQR